MKKTTNLLILIFLLLSVGTIWYLQTINSKNSTILGADRNFKVENPDEIYKIFIAKRTGKNTTLVREGNHWICNGKFRARPDAVENLLDAISNIRLQFIPPKSALDNIVKELATYGIKVEIYNRRGKKIKAYYVGGTAAGERGTVMIMDGAAQAYVVELHLLEGQIRIRYELEGDQWRDRAVFRKPLKEIHSVSIDYPKQKSKSFSLVKDGTNYKVKPLYPLTEIINRPLDKGNIEIFLMGFKEIIAEGFENEYPHKDSIKQIIPFCIITLKDVQGEEKKVTLYPYRNVDAFGKTKSEVVERYFADINTGDFMLVQHRVFQKILWAYDFFFEKPKGQ